MIPGPGFSTGNFPKVFLVSVVSRRVRRPQLQRMIWPVMTLFQRTFSQKVSGCPCRAHQGHITQRRHVQLSVNSVLFTKSAVSHRRPSGSGAGEGH